MAYVTTFENTNILTESTFKLEHTQKDIIKRCTIIAVVPLNLKSCWIILSREYCMVNIAV